MKPLTFLLALALAGSLAWALMAARQLEKLREANRLLLQETTELKAQLNQQSSARTARRDEELERLRDQVRELGRLRGEVTQLRDAARQAEELARQNEQLRSLAEQAQTRTTAPPPQQPVAQYSREQWKFAGYSSPEATLVSAIWAMSAGDPAAYLDSLTPEEQARMAKAWEGKDETEVAAKQQADVSTITGIRVLAQQFTSNNEVTMSVAIEGTDRTERVTVRRIGNDWKFGGFIRQATR